MKLGQYQIVMNEKHRRSVSEPSKEREQELGGSVCKLANILGDSSLWTLTGSLAIAMNLGRFYRDCNDADILADKENLERLILGAKKKGYELFNRLADIKVSPIKNIYVYQNIPVSQVKTNYRHLKLIRVDSRESAFDGDGILDSIEIFPYERIDERTVKSLDKGFIFSGQISTKMKTEDGQEISVASREYLQRIKEVFIEKRDQPRKKDVLDLAILKELFERERLSL
jgi:hypothetical protein